MKKFQIVETTFNLDSLVSTRCVIETCATREQAKQRLDALRKAEAEVYASVARAWEVAPISN